MFFFCLIYEEERFSLFAKIFEIVIKNLKNEENRSSARVRFFILSFFPLAQGTEKSCRTLFFINIISPIIPPRL